MSFLELVEKAISAGTFVPLFRGEGEYAPESLDHMPVKVTTDWDALMRLGIFTIYKNDPDPRIPQFCKEAVYSLASGDAFDVWCAFNVCFVIVFHEKRQSAPFKILNDDMISKVRNGIMRERNALRKLKIWVGERLNEGLWTDIVSASKVAEDDYGIQFLDTLDLETLLREKLTAFLEVIRKYGGSVRRRNMDYPPMNADYGEYSLWEPCPARNTPTRKELEDYYGVTVSEEFYSYLSLLRFAELELQYGEFICNIFPLFEDNNGNLKLLPGIEIDNSMYYALGTAINRNSSVSYAIVLKNEEGIYLLEDGTENLTYLTSGICRLLFDSEV